MRKHFRPVVTFLLVVSLAGCSKVRLALLQPFKPDEGAKADYAPETAVYKVKVARKGKDPEDLHTLGGSRRFLHAGDTVGFQTEPEGRVLAVAAEETFPLRTLPRDRFYVWAYKTVSPDAEDRGEQFQKFLESLGFVALIGGVIALLVYTFPAWLFPDSDCDDDDIEITF